MRKQRKENHVQVSEQVKRVRKMYSEIGEPLPAELIIDLYQHLGKALEVVETIEPQQSKRRRVDA